MRVLYSVNAVDLELQQELHFLQLRFENGCLKVAEHLEDDSHAPQRIMDVLQKAWLLQQFSVTRWDTLEVTGRIFMLIKTIGLHDLVRFCMYDTQASDYHTSG